MTTHSESGAKNTLPYLCLTTQRGCYCAQLVIDNTRLMKLAESELGKVLLPLCLKPAIVCSSSSLPSQVTLIIQQIWFGLYHSGLLGLFCSPLCSPKKTETNDQRVGQLLFRSGGRTVRKTSVQQTLGGLKPHLNPRCSLNPLNLLSWAPQGEKHGHLLFSFLSGQTSSHILH